MTKPFPRIVFFGTPAFAVASLRALVEAGFPVVAVVTAPDKPAGRSMQLQQSACKQYALQQNLTLLQPEKLKDPAFIDRLRSYKADLQVVVAFRMLPEVVWNMPPLGTINVHASLLPQYRGAAPIHWAIIHGEKETGITTFRLKHEIDTGNILLQEKMPIGHEQTAGELHDQLMDLGAAVLVKTVQGLADGTLSEQEQENLLSRSGTPLKHAPKIFTDTCKIDFTRTASEVNNLVRGLSPYPGAFTHLQGKVFKIYKSHPETGHAGHPPGTLVVDGQSLKFATADGYLHCAEVQLEGRKRMPASEFLKGNKLL
jgi:methionyl-tRNA formyltransferase